MSAPATSVRQALLLGLLMPQVSAAYSLTVRCLLLALIQPLVVSPNSPHGVPQSPVHSAGGSSNGACETVSVPMCRGIGYNLTSMPNQFNHDTQEEAGLEVHQFWPLVEIHCSPYLRFFLCSMYAPICMPTYHKVLPACREVCETARDGCLPIMGKYGFAWPDQMNCLNFPEFGDTKELCMGINVAEVASHASTVRPLSTGLKDLMAPSDSPSAAPRAPSTPGECPCRPPLVVIDNVTSALYNKVSVGGKLNCAIRCEGLYFTDAHERRFARFWIGFWASVCIFSTLMTSLTFLVDTHRFVYPERPILCLSACYLLVSVGYVLPIILGHDAIICESYGRDAEKLLRHETSGPPLCTLTFVLVYFFGMAASSWWVILSLTWYMAAGLKWGQEAIARYSPYYHVLAWGLPACQTVAVLALSVVDGDPIAGICYVGNQSSNNARLFLLIPLSAHLLLGVTFLVAGFIALFRIRSSLRQQGLAKTDKLEKLMLRIGVFSVLYTVPATVIILCHFYEQHWRAGWDLAHNGAGVSCSSQPSGVSSSMGGAEAYRGGGVPVVRDSYTDQPDFSVFMLKYFLSVVVGITSGFWIWSGKTINSWRSCYNRVLCRRPAAKPTGTDGVLRGGGGGVGYSSTKYSQVTRGSARTSSYGGRVNVGSNATSLIEQ